MAIVDDHGKAPKRLAEIAAMTDPLRFVQVRSIVMSREELIARIAYFKSLNRGLIPGEEVADWLAAEIEVDQQLCGM